MFFDLDLERTVKDVVIVDGSVPEMFCVTLRVFSSLLDGDLDIDIVLVVSAVMMLVSDWDFCLVSVEESEYVSAHVRVLENVSVSSNERVNVCSVLWVFVWDRRGGMWNDSDCVEVVVRGERMSVAVGLDMDKVNDSVNWVL